MLKNLTIYRVLAGETGNPDTFEQALQADQFVECGASQEKSVGWVPPRGHANDAMYEIVGGQLFLKLMTETKVIPGDVIKRKVDESVASIEVFTGRKPGKKERRAIADDVRLSLLPMAFTKQSSAMIWVDLLGSNLLCTDGGDDALTWLVKAVDGLALQPVNTRTSPAAAMAMWLSTKEAPPGFTVDRECELKACDASGAVVKYGRHALDTDEVAQHIAMGKVPTRLALTWDGRVSFVLTDTLHLKKITMLEGVFEQPAGEMVDNFDADCAIFTGEMRKLIPDLLAALGGEVRPLPALPGARK